MFNQIMHPNSTKLLQIMREFLNLNKTKIYKEKTKSHIRGFFNIFSNNQY